MAKNKAKARSRSAFSELDREVKRAKAKKTPVRQGLAGLAKASGGTSKKKAVGKVAKRRAASDRAMAEMDSMISAGRKKHGPGYRGETQVMTKRCGKKHVTSVVKLAPTKKKAKAKPKAKAKKR